MQKRDRAYGPFQTASVSRETCRTKLTRDVSRETSRSRSDQFFEETLKILFVGEFNLDFILSMS